MRNDYLPDQVWRSPRPRGASSLVILLIGLIVGFGLGFCSDARSWAMPPGVEHGAIQSGADEYIVAMFDELELLAGVPDWLRGITLAKVAAESRFNPRARGDGKCTDGTDARTIRRQRRCNDGSEPHWRAQGCAQLHGWATMDRSDCELTTREWLERVVHRLTQTVPVACPTAKGERAQWFAAINMVNRSPRWRAGPNKGAWRCGGSEPRAWKRLQRWGSSTCGRRRSPVVADRDHPPSLLAAADRRELNRHRDEVVRAVCDQHIGARVPGVFVASAVVGARPVGELARLRTRALAGEIQPEVLRLVESDRSCLGVASRRQDSEHE